MDWGLMRVLRRRIYCHRLKSPGVERLLYDWASGHAPVRSRRLHWWLRVHRLVVCRHHLALLVTLLLLGNVFLLSRCRCGRWWRCHLISVAINRIAISCVALLVARTDDGGERGFLVAVLDIQAILRHRVVLDLVSDALGFQLLLPEVHRVLLLDLYCVVLQVVFEGGLDAVLLLVQLEHLVGVPPVGLRVQLQAHANVAIQTVRAVRPRLQQLSLCVTK